MREHLIDSLSVFFPAYNEERNLKETVEMAIKVVKNIAVNWEVIIVNDGSNDKTKDIAQELKNEEGRIKIVTHKKNKGYGEALKSGFYNSKYAWIATTDADGQFDFSEIIKLIDKAKKGYDVVIGFRINRQDSLIRKINGLGWTWLSNLLLGINVHDVDCSFKLVKKEVIDKISHLESTRGGMISPELLAKAKKSGFKIAEVGVHHYPRIHGSQTGANINVIIKSFVDLIKLWQKLK
ncbi:hypothetical protein A2961_00325 [Candidatus Woesebacteria bacterium RIFCSPLOWO2_01_FULL_39_21]|uniref:Glycosyltransferase 2-like domain-containing protein n=1 Tax=Candidatus Woesebacteria bacterium RIFCSPLOWO2_01_FULL_39_21 TaxID=1802519 RepID=A0A1F8BHU2_9BACT|nr:MAG: hypothetical protein A2691_03795 [Candidatus Woesebacteria bacterium RIFCSPHIGHO2_01_FULL_39_23]OGM63626.1 MAG: hypothetical protein A2961_00325 [Candidatus Woesebacteria bacterium RIFCSPLOWO2_01_FULL_39_21]